MPRPIRHVSPARRLPDELVAAAHDYQHRNRCTLVQVGEHFDVAADRLRDEFRRRGLKCVKIATQKKHWPKPKQKPDQVCTDEAVRAAHAWYMANKRVTLEAAAAQFGISYTKFVNRMFSLQLPSKQYTVNPLDAQFVRPFREMAAEIERRRILRLRYNP